MTEFNISAYMGKWYQLLHYPSFFDGSDTYNTTAEYTLQCDGTVKVVNSNYSNGVPTKIVGQAVAVPGKVVQFRVDFPIPDIAKYIDQNEQQGGPPPFVTDQGPNYVIETLWPDENCGYKYAVVTDPSRQSLFVLSRTPSPSLEDYNCLITHVNERFDRRRIVATPHYEIAHPCPQKKCKHC